VVKHRRYGASFEISPTFASDRRDTQKRDLEVVRLKMFVADPSSDCWLPKGLMRSLTSDGNTPLHLRMRIRWEPKAAGDLGAAWN
jgi:hypothetical protein